MASAAKVAAEEEPSADAIRRAACLLQFVRKSKPFTRFALQDERQRRALVVALALSPFLKAALAFYLVLYFFEVPPWCWLPEDQCGDPSVIPRSPLSAQIHVSVSRLLQLLCLSLFLAHEVALGQALWQFPAWTRFSLLVISFAILDNVMACFNGYGLPPTYIYWSPLLRPLVFLGLDRSVQKFVRQAASAISNKNVRDLIIMQLIFTLLWGWIGLLLFARTNEGDAYFGGMELSIRNLFIMFTSANYPDIMMPAYSRSRWAFFYFAFFLLLSLFVLFNVLLAAMYSAYRSTVKERLRQREERFTVSLDVIYDSLGTEESWGISSDVWQAVFCAYCHDDSRWNQERASILFHLAANGEMLERDRWHKLASLLVNPDVTIQRHAPASPPRWLLTAEEIMCYAVDAIVVAELAGTVMRTNKLLKDHGNDWRNPQELRAVHGLCSVVYVAEVIVRAFALRGQGLRREVYRNVVDFMTAAGYASLEVWSFFTKDYTAMRWLALFRVMRAERILWRLPGVRRAIKIVLFLFGTFRSAGSALILVFYFYSTVGVQVFGGLIRTDSERLQGTAFATAGGTGYYTNNFNDFGSGIVVLFELMVVNNWFLIAEGLAAVLGDWHRFAWMFCISFYFMIHTIILNVLVTSVVENYERLVKETDGFEFNDSGIREHTGFTPKYVAIGEDELLVRDGEPNMLWGDDGGRLSLVGILGGHARPL